MKRDFCASGVMTAEAQLFGSQAALKLGRNGAHMSALRHFSARVRESARGQTMAEYALILLAVAVIVYASYQTFGTTISSDLTTVDTLF